MRKRIILQLAFTMLFASQKAQVIKTEKGVVLKNFGSSTRLLKVEVISSHIIHIIASPICDFSDKGTEGLTAYDHPEFSVKIDDDRITLRTDALTVSIDPKSGRISYRDERNKLLLEENNRFYKPYKGFLENTWSVKQEFKWTSDEALYDLNQGNVGLSNIRGKNLDLFPQGTKNPNSLIISSRGYGLLWSNPSLSRFCDGSNCSYLWSEIADQVDYFFLYGPSNEEVVFNYCKLSGKLLFLPKWAVSDEHSGKNIEVPRNLSEVDRQFLKKNLMFDVNVIDQTY